MKPEYPHDVRFLLAEDIRQESSGLVSIMGVHAGDDVVLQPEVKPGGAIASLVIYALFKGGHGTFNGSLRLLSPTNEELRVQDLGQISKKEDDNLALGIKVLNFKVPEFGDYRAIIMLDKQEYSYTFSIVTKKQ